MAMFCTSKTSRIADIDFQAQQYILSTSALEFVNILML